MGGSESKGGRTADTPGYKENDPYFQTTRDPLYQDYLKTLNLDGGPKTPDFSNLMNPGASVQATIDGFRAWKAKNQDSKTEHDQYVKALQEKTGRQATILAAPGAEPDPTTLVGAPKTFRKGGSTLIGGR